MRKNHEKLNDYAKRDKTQLNTQMASKSNFQHMRSELKKHPALNLSMDLQTSGQQCQ